MNNNTEGISDEQLVYLNDNLDLVTKYMNTPLVASCFSKYGPLSSVAVSRGDINVWAKVALVLVRVNYLSKRPDNWLINWRELLQYVEDNANTPLILK